MPNPQKNPVVKTLGQYFDREVGQFGSLLAKSVPATVVEVEANCTIVSVNIEISGINIPNIRCPVGWPQWDRLPIQKGDKGVLLSADFYIGGMSGIGGGTADRTQMANLSNGIWFPIGNTAFDDSEDQQSRIIYGPDGVILRNTDKTDLLTLKKQEGVMVHTPENQNCLGANLTEANNDTEAKLKNIPQWGFYRKPDGSVHVQLLP